jgi:hypothetical protein
VAGARRLPIGRKTLSYENFSERMRQIRAEMQQVPVKAADQQ